MHPKSTRMFTSHVVLAMALAAGLSFAPLGEARAEHSGHHAQQGTKKRGPAAAATPAVAGYQAAHANMMRGMSLPYTGDPDVDFRVQMIPHHQGAIDMARVALRHATDPWTRQMAEGVIVEQQRESCRDAAMARAPGRHAACGRTAAPHHHGELVSDHPGRAGNPSRVARTVVGARNGRAAGFKVKHAVGAFGAALQSPRARLTGWAQLPPLLSRARAASAEWDPGPSARLRREAAPNSFRRGLLGTGIAVCRLILRQGPFNDGRQTTTRQAPNGRPKLVGTEHALGKSGS